MRLALLILSLLSVTLHAQIPFTFSDRAFIERTSPLLVGLQGYWRLEESSGTRYDCSRNGNHLTANNSPGQAAGKVGNCATFVIASSQRLSLASSASTQAGASDFTISLWVNLTAKGSSQALVCKHNGASVVGSEYWVGYVSGTDRFQFNAYSGSSTTYTVNASSFGSPPTATWCFVVVWRDASAATVNIQVNNGTVNTTSSASGTINATSTGFDIGAQDNGSSFTGGSIDEVGFWKRVLTTTERTQLYNSGNGVTFPRFQP